MGFPHFLLFGCLGRVASPVSWSADSKSSLWVNSVSPPFSLPSEHSDLAPKETATWLKGSGLSSLLLYC